jgi:antitoxin component HigA of HigAB toxin-antitoxin module
MAVSTEPATRYIATNLGSVLDQQGRKVIWLAAQLGVSHPLVSMVISGKRTISAEHAELAAMALDTPVEDIFAPVAILDVTGAS